MPTDLNDLIIYIAAFIFVIALIAIGAWLLKSLTSGGRSGGGGILRGRERRLGVVEAANVDGRRKLVLLRRDDVEHLIMTGGPVDLVIESGIEPYRGYDRPAEPAHDDDRVIIQREDIRRPTKSYDED